MFESISVILYEFLKNDPFDFTIADFIETCREERIEIVRSYAVNQRGEPIRFGGGRFCPNIFGAQGVFLLATELPRQDDESRVG